MELRAAPPSAGRSALTRDRLSLRHFSVPGTRLIDVSAPQGYGRTQLLSQWYHEAAQQKTPVIWLSMAELETTHRFAESLALATYRAAGALVDLAFVDWVFETTDPLEALTGWVVEMQQLQIDCVLLLDDADLADSAVIEEGLAFVLANTPAHLMVGLSTRPGHPIFRLPAFFGTPLVRITANELRFSLGETTELIEQALPGRETINLPARVQAMTDGWPLGVQLALSSEIENGIARGRETSVELALGHYFNENILSRQPPDVVRMLTSLAYLDPICQDLAQAVAGPDAPVRQLERIAGSLPLLVYSGEGSWFNIHPGFRGMLQDLQKSWPLETQQACARAAFDWYRANDLLEEAAQQARRIGDTKTALDLAEKAVREMIVHGRPAEVVRWIETLPEADLMTRRGFWYSGAWAYANTNRPEKAKPLLNAMQANPGPDIIDQYEADLVQAALALYSDALDLLEGFVAKWPTVPASVGPDEARIHTAITVIYQQLSGVDVTSRIPQSDADIADSTPVVAAFLHAIRAKDLLNDGKPKLAQDVLRRAIDQVTSVLDRRNFAVSMLQAQLAFVLTELGEYQAARTLLLGRLPFVEEVPLPDALIYGYIAAARLSEAGNQLDLAEVQLTGLIALGRARHLPRVIASGFAEQISLHNRNGQTLQARQAYDAFEAFETTLSNDTPARIHDFVRLKANLARAELVGKEDAGSRLQAARHAQGLATDLNLKIDRLKAQALAGQALMAHDPERGAHEIAEIIKNAKAWGLTPLATSIEQGTVSEDKEDAQMAPHAPVQTERGARKTDLLTQREFDILCNLAAHLSNKEIALSLGLSDETVKWHLKNLFRKLDASDRKVAVVRGRMLGII
jgi:LuxR family maltose regulon positive regulatory protein